MKKILTSLLVLCALSAQSQIGQGTFIIDPVVGVPNAGRMYLNSIDVFGLSTTDNVVITGIPVQLGLKAEYLVADQIGIGLESNYEQSGYDRTYENYNSNTNSYQDTTVQYGETKLRF